MTKPYASHHFIANCFIAGNIKGKWRYLIPAEPQFITTCSYPTITTSKSRLLLLCWVQMFSSYHNRKDTMGFEFGQNRKNRYFGPSVDTGKFREILHSYHNKENLVAHVDNNYHHSSDCNLVPVYRQTETVVDNHNHHVNCCQINCTSQKFILLVLVLDPCEILRTNENKGYCQLELRAKSHRVLGRGDWYCSDKVSVVRNVDSPSKFLMYPRFLQVVLDNQVDDMSTHNTRYTSPALTQKVFTNMRRVEKGFLGVNTPLFASKLVQPQPQAKEEVEVHITPAPPSTASAPSPPSLQDPTPTSPQDQPLTPHALPLHEQPTTPHESLMPLLTTLLETCATLSQKGMLNQEEVNAASKGVSVVSAPELVSATEPTIFDDEDVTLTIAQTLIKLKAKKDKLFDEQIAQKLHDEEVQKAAARDKQEKDHLERALYQNLKKKPFSIAQAKKNMIIYLKNMAGYKMKFFRGMTYDKVRPIFKREYKKVQTLFKPDKDVKEPKKQRVADETLLQESFKKLRAADVLDDLLWKLRRYMHDPLKWKLYTDCGVHHVSSTRGHDIFMLTEKDYPLSNAIMIRMLSGKLQVEEDNEMARDLVMKIFMEANKPKSRSLDTSSK
nr:hypothetical protein [Tanacetum cinerariifolium]